MARKPFEVELEAMCRREIRHVQQKLKELKRQEGEADDAIEVNLDLFTRQRELRAYITHYRIALAQLQRYGKDFTGRPIEEGWLEGLTTVQNTVFTARFRDKETFEEIARKWEKANPQIKMDNPRKIYESAYRKVALNFAQSSSRKTFL